MDDLITKFPHESVFLNDVKIYSLQHVFILSWNTDEV